MLTKYLKIVLRSMLRNKSFTIINVAGLTIGLVSFLAITLYVVDEFSYDRYHKNKDRVYRAIIRVDYDGQVQKWGAVPNLVAPTAMKEIPEVEKATRLFHHNFGDIGFISTADEKFSETELYYADPEIFNVFTIPLIKGNEKKVIDRPGTVILSESAVKKYFGTADPIGQILTVDNRTALEVTGVYKDFPPNSLLKCQLIASFSSNWFGLEKNQSWGNASFDTFFLLHEGTSKENAEQKIQAMLEKNITKEDRWFTINLQPLLDIRLHSGDLTASIDRKQYGNIEQVKILSALGIIIILIAAINYMNLTTAQSQRRNKEVGISKTLGATHSQLTGKFYFEASVFVLTSMIASVLLIVLILPILNSISGKQISLSFLSSVWFWISFSGIWFTLTFLSGFYPAMYLSSFSPKAILQKTSNSGSQATIRKGLVIMQFSASVILIVCSIIFYKQMNFIRDKKLGYDPEQVIAVMVSAAKEQSQVASLKAEFESFAEVKRVARSQSYPGIGTSGYTLASTGRNDQSTSILTSRATHEVLDVLGIKLLAGRTLPENKDQNDTTIQVLLNKSAVNYLQLTPEEAVGKKVVIFNGRPSEVVGVTDDFHFASMHQQIGPYCFTNNVDNRYIYLLVKVETNDLPATLTKLETSFKKLIPASFEYTFLDEQMAKLYRSEERLTEVMLLSSAIAIFIACMGLYALAAYTAEQRIKEIGIRKVLGASVPHLVGLLSKDFMKLVLIAFVIGLPVGYYFMQQWLEGFVYKTTIDVSVFIIAAIVTAAIAWFTVSFESIRTASNNPVNSLRNE